MDIKYFGYSCFRIKGKDVVLVTNPFSPSIPADIVIFSDQENQARLPLVTKAVKREEPFVITRPGEYENSWVFILGIPFKGKTIYVITMDGLRLVYLGEIDDKLSDRQLEEVDGVDLLFLPVGGKPFISPKQAALLVGQIEPTIIIPMAYKMPGLTGNLAPVEDFLKEIGMEGKNPVDKLVLSKEKLPKEPEVVILNAKS